MTHISPNRFVRSLRLDHFSTPFRGIQISKRLGERPLVARWVLGVVLAFSKGHIGRFHEYASSTRTGSFAVRAGVLHARHDGMGDLARAWGATVTSHVGHNHRTVAETEL
jgi:hypothetical protein